MMTTTSWRHLRFLFLSGEASRWKSDECDRGSMNGDAVDLVSRDVSCACLLRFAVSLLIRQVYTLSPSLDG